MGLFAAPILALADPGFLPLSTIVAEDLRGALRALDVLVGKTDVEAVLDVVFAGFCLGK